MTGRVVFDGRANLSYRQLLVGSGEQEPLFDAAFAGRTNGLLGAAVPGALVLVTGTHTGDVGLRVVVHDAAPPLDPRREDVVEASFVPVGPDITIHGLMSDLVATFSLPTTTYRVRWSGTGIDEAYDGVVAHDEPLVDTFELALWPAPAAPDEIVRQASRRGREDHLAATPEGRAQLEAWAAPADERLTDRS